MTSPNLPYFDILLEGRQKGEPAALAFERFVHWGYWEGFEPKETLEDYRAAAERLDAKVLAPARLKDGTAHLDAGCGFGGTLAGIDARHNDMRLTGVNIDERQLAVARGAVHASHGNTITFTQADACALPFDDASFDSVSAVECIFHFPSRAKFLKEAARVMKPGGRLTLSDFVPRWIGARESALARWVEARVASGYGDLGGGWQDGDYAAMAAAAGLKVILDQDITRQTMPTYPMLLRFLRENPGDAARSRLESSTRWLAWLSHFRILLYKLVAFEKPA